MAARTQRNSSFELLRIFAIVCIVLSHLSWHGYADKTTVYSFIDSAFNRELLRCLNLGNLGVDIFVMISGYFLIKSTKVSLKKALKLFGVTWFYGVVISTIFTYFGNRGGISECLKILFFPLVYTSSWFVTVYLILYTFHPFINKMLLSVNRNEKTRKCFFIILSLCFLWWVFPYTFLLRKDCYCNPVISFFILYVIGAYIRLYGSEINTKIVGYSIVLCAAIWILLPVLAELSGIQLAKDHVTYFYNTISLLTLLLSASVVLIVSRIHCHSKIVNQLATFVFPIYLISDNYWIRINIYDNVFHCKDFANSPYLFVIIIGQAFAIIFACILIDLTRRYLILPCFNFITGKLRQSMYTKLDKYSNELFS